MTLALLLRGNGGSVLIGADSVRGSGNMATEPRTVPAFTAVELAGTTNASVRVGSPQSIVVHADDNVVHQVRTGCPFRHLGHRTMGSFSTRAPDAGLGRRTGSASASLSGSGTMLVAGTPST